MNDLTADEFARWWKETGEHELRQILFWRWDPVGVAHYFPNTADEYDDYAPQLVQLLRRGGTAEDVAGYLLRIEREQMGLSQIGEVEDVAALIESWFGNSPDSWAQFGPMRR